MSKMREERRFVTSKEVSLDSVIGMAEVRCQLSASYLK
jgi:hypothetical protein